MAFFEAALTYARDPIRVFIAGTADQRSRPLPEAYYLCSRQSADTLRDSYGPRVDEFHTPHPDTGECHGSRQDWIRRNEICDFTPIQFAACHKPYIFGNWRSSSDLRRIHCQAARHRRSSRPLSTPADLAVEHPITRPGVRNDIDAERTFWDKSVIAIFGVVARIGCQCVNTGLPTPRPRICLFMPHRRFGGPQNTDSNWRCCTDRVSSVNTGFCHDHGYA